MKSRIMIGSAVAALGWIAVAGTGATQGWVNYRIAQSETNTMSVVDGKIHSASNSIMADTQRRIDEHLSTNGVTGAWVEYKISEQETNTQIVVDRKIANVQTNVYELVQSSMTTITESENSTTYKNGKLSVVVVK